MTMSCSGVPCSRFVTLRSDTFPEPGISICTSPHVHASFNIFQHLYTNWRSMSQIIWFTKTTHSTQLVTHHTCQAICMYAIAGVIYRHQCNICRFNGVATCQYLEKVIWKKSPPQKNWSYFYAILCHAMPYAPSGYLVVFFKLLFIATKRKSAPGDLKATLKITFFHMASVPPRDQIKPWKFGIPPSEVEGL